MQLSDLATIAVIGGAVWAATSGLLGGAKVINERRDVVLIGKIKDQALSREHRSLILYSDWLPMTIGVVTLVLGAMATVIVLPWLFMDVNRYSIGLSALGGVALLVIGGLNVGGAVVEFRLMRRTLSGVGADPTG